LNQIVQSDAHLLSDRLVLFGYVIGVLVDELEAVVFARFEFVSTTPKELVQITAEHFAQVLKFNQISFLKNNKSLI
jgi:hypothetical protein